jgi:hypothetical protein
MITASCDRETLGPSPATSLQVTAANSFVDVGTTQELHASAKDASGATLTEAEIAWSSSNPAVLEVADGRATGLATGTAYVRALAGQARDSVLVTVESPVAKLVVWPADTIRIIQGREATLFIEMSDSTGARATHSIRIASSDSAKVTIHGQVLAATGLGFARVTVIAGTHEVGIPVEVVTGEGYIVRSLGTFIPKGINNLGWIAGASGGQAALWRNGEITVLPHDGFASSVAVAVNDSGMVMGTGIPADGGQPVLWTWRDGATERIPLGGFPGVGGPIESVTLEGVNNLGEIVGAAWGSIRAGASGFHWNGVQTDWFPGSEFAYDINDHGVMVGSHVFEKGLFKQIPPPPSWIEGAELTAGAINERGEYVGTYNAGCYSGFYWNGSRMVDMRQAAPCSPFSEINEYSDMLGHWAGGFIIYSPTILIRNSIATKIEIPGYVGKGNGYTGLNDLGQFPIVLSQAPGTAYLVTPAS